MIDLTALLKAGESETLEFKERWNDGALQTLAAFANTRGGILLVGVNNKGEVVGWQAADQTLQAISSQVTALRIHPSVSVETSQGVDVLVIETARSAVPVACHGRYYRRVGNTTETFQPDDLAHFFVGSLGVTWDSVVGNYSMDEIGEATVRRFVHDSRARLPYLREDESIEAILKKLDLLQDGRLTRGAILLFGKNPQHHFLMAEIHIGRFKDAITITDDKLLKGNLFQQLEQAMRLFQQYLQVRYEIPSSMEGQEPLQAVRRREIWDYPPDALREAIVNALVHRDYFNTAMDIMVRVYDDQVVITNPGGLPQGVTIEELKRENHSSVHRNPLLAQVFYYTQFVEKWGTGTFRMIRTCREQGLPEPEFEDRGSRFEIVFAKDRYTKERLLRMGLSERQIQAVLWVKEKGSIVNTEYQERLNVAKRTATRDLSDLVDRDILEQVGRRGKGIAYRLRSAIKGPVGP